MRREIFRMSLPVDDHPQAPRGDDHDPGPPPVQFSVKSLLVFTTIAALLFALLSRVSNVGAAVVVWVSLLIAGHVVGNAMGSRAAARVIGRRHTEDLPRLYSASPIDPRQASAPTTTLGRNAGLGIPLYILVGCGAIVGSLGGTTLVWIHNDRQLNGPALGLAAFSSAVVGAFLTFLAASCFQVWTKAWRAASRHASKD